MGDRAWVSDWLYELVGFSDRSVEDYVMAIGASARSSHDALDKLAKFDISRDGKGERFAAELVGRFGKSTKKTNADFVKQSQQYSLVGMDDDAGSRKRVDKDRKDKKKKKKKQKKDEEEQGKAKQLENKGVEGETEYERQLREYQEFVGTGKEGEEEGERLKAKALKKLNDKKEKEARKREEKDRKREELSVEDLRKESRRSYLKKREERELQLLRATIRDEEELFQNVELTERERKDLESRKELERLIESRKELEEKAKGDFYALPDSYQKEDGTYDNEKRNKLLSERYEEDKRPVSEQQMWEERQTKIAKQTGARGHKKGKTDDYELVLDDSIDFVAHELVDGKNEPKVKAGDDEAKKVEAKARSMAETRRSLPIYAYRDDLLRAIKDHQVLIVVGETGSGKTTQIPQYLHESGYTEIGKVGCTQPRRVAAMSVAARVATELDSKLGNEVGYSIRFEDCTSDRTVIKYMTDGMLLREFLTSPDLANYSVMIIDEAHERSLNTDVLFGLLKDISKFRTDLRLIISSATLDAQKFAEYFDGAPIFNIPGRRYPVEILYTKAPEADYLDASVLAALQIHVSEPTPGDILIFLTGQEEIERARDILMSRTRGLGSKIKELIICPIYASLPSEEQAKVFLPTPPGARKVVLSTNIAETSLTIDGICHVIDTGFCKQTSYDPRTGMDSLIVSPVSQAGANQRAGRAGRTAPGKCFRLFTAWSFKHELEENTVPEIQRTNLSSTVLMLQSLGIKDLIHFDFLDPPPAETLIKSLEQLYALGALNDKGELTKLGRRMAEFPADPMLSKMLLAAEKYGCVEEILTVCAMLDVNAAVFYRPPEKAIHADNAKANFGRGVGAFGDHMALKNVYEQWRDTNYSTNWCYENYIQIKSLRRARDVRDQLTALCDRVELERNSNPDSENIRKAITAGYFYHTAKLQKDGSYKTIKNQHTVAVHPSSSLFKEDPLPKWLVYHQLQFTKQEYMRQIIVIKPEWLVEIAPHFYKPNDIDDGLSKKKLPKLAAARKQKSSTSKFVMPNA